MPAENPYSNTPVQAGVASSTLQLYPTNVADINMETLVRLGPGWHVAFNYTHVCPEGIQRPTVKLRLRRRDVTRNMPFEQEWWKHEVSFDGGPWHGNWALFVDASTMQHVVTITFRYNAADPYPHVFRYHRIPGPHQATVLHYWYGWKYEGHCRYKHSMWLTDGRYINDEEPNASLEYM